MLIICIHINNIFNSKIFSVKISHLLGTDKFFVGTKAACFWCPGHLEGGRFGYSDGIKKHNKDFPRLFRIASVDIGEDELNCSICALKTSNLGLWMHDL